MAAAVKPRFHIALVIEGESLKKVISGDAVIVGRMENCDLEIRHPDVSRRHLKLSCLNNELQIEDLGSTNGTFLNHVKIAINQPMLLKSTDEIRFGSDGPIMKVELEISSMGMEAPKGLDPVDRAIPTPRLTPEAPKPKPVYTPPPKSTPFLDAQNDIEKMLREARQQVANTLQAAEVDAEKRVAGIHQRAKDTEARAEKFYEDRLREAVQRSEKIYSDAQEQSLRTLQDARKQAQLLRDQAEAHALTVREQAEKRCAELLAMAQERAEAMKENRLGEADDIIKAKEDQILKEAREYVQAERAALENSLKKLREERDQLQATTNKLHKEETKLREDLRHEEATAREALRREEVKVRDALHREEASTRETLRKETETSQIQLRKEQDSLVTVKAELNQLKAEAEKERQTAAELKRQREPLQKESESLATSLTGMKAQFEQKSKELPAQLAQLQVQFESDRQKIIAEEEARVLQLRDKTQQEVRKFEKELLADLNRRKDNFVREIMLMVESAYKSDTELWKKGLPNLEEKIASSFEGESFSPTTKNKSNVATPLTNVRRQERMRSLIGGLAVGAAFVVALQWTLTRIGSNPLQRAVASAQEEREKDLEARKFNPPQTPGLRDNYVDSVIYTQDFVKTYLDPQYQDAWFKAGSLYLLKTWRIDEDHSLQTLSAAAALVKELQARKDAIHPDFVKKGLDQMKDLEKDTLNRMKTIVGGEVRLESFKKFEKQYFEKYSAQIRK